MVDLIVKHLPLIGHCLSPTYSYNTTFREVTIFPYLKKEADVASETLCVEHMSKMDKVQQNKPASCAVPTFHNLN
jgi:hypothetical protein